MKYTEFPVLKWKQVDRLKSEFEEMGKNEQERERANMNVFFVNRMVIIIVK